MSNGALHHIPCEILYFNVLGATRQQDVVYLRVSASDYVPGNFMMNGVTSEPLWQAQQRDESPIGGAYGQINLAAGQETNLTFELLDNTLQPKILEKVVAMTFLDIDQPTTSRFSVERDGGGETLNVCTGLRSFGWSDNYNIYHNWTNGSVASEACHIVQSSAKGSPDDNPWDPQRKENNVVVGLSGFQRAKAFTIANYKQSHWTAKFSVKPSDDPVMNGATDRNLNFAFHKTSFCQQDKANEVIDDDCKMRKEHGADFNMTLCEEVAKSVADASSGTNANFANR